MPEVSVIITTYNRSGFLPDAINSVLDQTYKNYEIIVVDDGSTDNTRLLLKNSPVRYIWQQNKGPAASRNTGIRHARGKWIAFLDADDIWEPKKLEKQIAATLSYPDSEVIYCDMLFFGTIDRSTPNSFFDLLKWPPPCGYVFDKMVVRFFGHPSTLLVQYDVFKRIGLFDEGLRYNDDYDMLLRMAAYLKFAVVDEPLVRYRLHANQISNNYENVLVDHITCLNKIMYHPKVNLQIKKLIDSHLAGIYLEYAFTLTRAGKIADGLKQLFNSLKTNLWTIFPQSLSYLKRSFQFLFKRLAKQQQSGF